MNLLDSYRNRWDRIGESEERFHYRGHEPTRYFRPVGYATGASRSIGVYSIARLPVKSLDF